MKTVGYILLLLLPFGVGAGTLLRETFEIADGISAGSIDSQNGWTVDGGSGTVQSAVVYSGSQALEILEASISRDLSSDGSSVWISFQARIAVAPEANPSLDGFSEGAAFFVNTNRNLVAFSNMVPVELSAQMPTNVWMRFDVYCDFEASFWNLAMNGTNAAAGLSLPPSCKRVESFVVGNSGSEAGYVDQIDITDHEQVPVAGTLDVDGDGMPDWWEQKYFDGITAADPDAMAPNGVHSLLETYISGLGLDEAFVVSMNSLLTWPGRNGRLYSVYISTNLVDGFVLDEFEIPWDQAEYTLPSTNGSACFFRVSVELDNEVSPVH